MDPTTAAPAPQSDPARRRRSDAARPHRAPVVCARGARERQCSDDD
jgi:hypothetical protein